MSVSIKYKGTEIASASTEVTKTIKTAGKYCEADILVENTPDGGDAPVINPLSVTANGTYTAPSGVDGYSPVTVNVPQGITPTGNINITDTSVTDVTNYATATVVSENLTAENIKKNVNILGVIGSFEGGGGGSLPSSISKIDGGSFTVAAATETSTLPISHNLGVEPKGFMVWSEPLIGGSNSLNCVIATNYAIATQNLSNVKAAGGLLYSKGWNGYLGYNYLFDVKADVFGVDYIKVPNITISYLNSATYYWLAWA